MPCDAAKTSHELLWLPMLHKYFFLSFFLIWYIKPFFSTQKKKKKIHQTIILISYMEWELLFPIPSLMDQVKVINWCTLGLGDRRKTYFPKSMWLNNATDHLNPFYSKNYCKPSSKNFAFFFFFLEEEQRIWLLLWIINIRKIKKRDKFMYKFCAATTTWQMTTSSLYETLGLQECLYIT